MNDSLIYEHKSSRSNTIDPTEGKTTGEFEKAYEYEKERWEAEFCDGDYYTLSDVMESLNNLKLSHNADMQAKDKRIAELSKELVGTRTISGFKGVLNQRDDRIKELEAQISVAFKALQDLSKR